MDNIFYFQCRFNFPTSDLSLGDYDGRTPLHIASSEGNFEMSKFLLERGALVHKKDRNRETPLLCAINTGSLSVVRLLVQVGAHLSLPPLKVGERLVAAVKEGSLARLNCLLEAGADLSLADTSGQTCLGAAQAARNEEIITFLLSQGISV